LLNLLQVRLGFVFIFGLICTVFGHWIAVPELLDVFVRHWLLGISLLSLLYHLFQVLLFVSDFLQEALILGIKLCLCQLLGCD
jgi:hypothetical protein